MSRALSALKVGLFPHGNARASRLCLLSVEELGEDICHTTHNRNTTLLQAIQMPGCRSTRIGGARCSVGEGATETTWNDEHHMRGEGVWPPMARSKCTWRYTPANQRTARVYLTRQMYSNDISRLSALVNHAGGKHGLYVERAPVNVRACL